jgi:hypothetical protein
VSQVMMMITDALSVTPRVGQVKQRSPTHYHVLLLFIASSAVDPLEFLPNGLATTVNPPCFFRSFLVR